MMYVIRRISDQKILQTGAVTNEGLISPQALDASLESFAVEDGQIIRTFNGADLVITLKEGE